MIDVQVPDIQRHRHVSTLSIGGIAKFLPNAQADEVTVTLSGMRVEESVLLVLTKCSKLILRCNMISRLCEFPESLGRFLMHLDLSKNKIEVIGDALSLCTTLVTLNLSRNKLERIEGLDTLTGLLELNLGHNRIRSVTGLDRLTQLRILNLDGNAIEDLGDGLSQSEALEVLHLAFNDLTSVGVLTTLPKLRVVNLRANRVTSVPPQLSRIEFDLSENDERRVDVDHSSDKGGSYSVDTEPAMHSKWEYQADVSMHSHPEDRCVPHVNEPRVDACSGGLTMKEMPSTVCDESGSPSRQPADGSPSGVPRVVTPPPNIPAVDKKSPPLDKSPTSTWVTVGRGPSRES